ncbi:uncharacterized protein ISCGN_010912 [Ixodes scapularis]
MLDPIHHQGLRLSTGAFRTSPILSLYVEANGPSLEKRRFELGFMYSLRIRYVPGHPTLGCIEQIHYEQTFINKPSFVPPVAMRIRSSAESGKLDVLPSVVQCLGSVASWNLMPIHCELKLTKYNKKETPNERLSTTSQVLVQSRLPL